MKQIYLRVDGGPSIGSGHIQRCLSIAEALRESGANCHFLTSDDAMTDTILQRGFVPLILESSPTDISRELPLLQNLLPSQGSSLLVDTYAATYEYLKALLPITTLWVMDDFGETVLPCHGIIAYNVYTEKKWYDQRYPSQQKLLGPTYAPLRTEFQRLAPYKNQTVVKRIVLTTGGSDPLGMAEALLQAFLKRSHLAGLLFEVVVGPFHPNQKALQSLSKSFPHIRIHRGVTRMASLLSSCDLAISACGSTLYELCACGTPGVIFAFADNQLQGLKSFANGGYFLDAGDARKSIKQCVQRAMDCIEVLIAEPHLRLQMSEKIKALVDGKGSLRIATKIINDACRIDSKNITNTQ